VNYQLNNQSRTVPATQSISGQFFSASQSISQQITEVTPINYQVYLLGNINSSFIKQRVTSPKLVSFIIYELNYKITYSSKDAKLIPNPF
jgi:hypothetical protein